MRLSHSIKYDFRQKFGARIREFRLERGISQSTFASLVGILPSTLCRIEAGYSECPIRLAAKIAHELGMNLSKLLEGLI
ncbi:MAG: helix-turn-helix domain-containing protein [Phycisphaerae bacterium]